MEKQAVREKVRILFVDDEGLITITMPVILEQHGYAVTAVGSVDEALSQIASAHFDVLLSDLNIGQPGDGFTVVSAMRRTQPECITLILTGYPGFDSALEAIRSQVDDYLIKPTPIPNLIDLIERKLRNPRHGAAAATKRVSQVLREEVFEITQRTLRGMKFDPGIEAIPLSDEQRIEFVPRLLEELATMLEQSDRGQATPEVIESAKMRGFKQHRQGYSMPMVAVQMRILEQAIYEVIHEHMRSLNLSRFMFDLRRLNANLGVQLEHTLLAFLSVEQKIGSHAER
jgi:ActR/RegA family two-component response regulator